MGRLGRQFLHTTTRTTRRFNCVSKRRVAGRTSSFLSFWFRGGFVLELRTNCGRPHEMPQDSQGPVSEVERWCCRPGAHSGAVGVKLHLNESSCPSFSLLAGWFMGETA